MLAGGRSAARRGVLFTFQDPLRYDSVRGLTYCFDRISYFAWRLFQGNYLRGLKTRIRRAKGYYRDDLPEDAAEYHVVRNGVDQAALTALLRGAGLDCSLHRYWSTQSAFFQYVGTRLHLANTFGNHCTENSRLTLMPRSGCVRAFHLP